MVSKVAVIALVAIVAVPIMLGYAMNLEQVTETEYTTTGDPVNVTQLLQQSVRYTYAHGSIYDLNTKFSNKDNIPILPEYQTYTNTKTSMHIGYDDYYPGKVPVLNVPLSTWGYLYLQFNYDFATSSHPTLQLLANNTTVTHTYDHFISLYYDISNSELFVSYYSPNGLSVYTTNITITANEAQTTYTRMSYSPNSAGFTGTGFINYLYTNGTVNPGTTGYVDFSDGYTFSLTPLSYSPYSNPAKAKLPQYTKSVLLTIDLSSLTDANTVFRIGQLIMTKTTTDDIVHWTVTNELGDIEPFEIYYDNSTTNNTYQIKITADPASRRSVGSGLSGYDLDYDLKYIGAWPISIGEANYYQEYEASTTVVMLGELDLNSQITFRSTSLVTPIMRIDDAEYRAFEYPIMVDQTYAPADFKSNPATTISNITQHGTALSFGGNTYTVSNGSITLGSHKVPVKDLVLSSVPNPSGGYDNKIGNTVISTTADPSTITFGGQWSASISTTAQESYTYTETKWVAGSFAWDGIDQNFLMVGLLVSLGAFIALGIYARQTRASIWPLLIVCGGAALLFFMML